MKAKIMPNMTTTIYAQRLDRRLITLAFLEAVLAGDPAWATELLGVTIPADW